MNKELERDLGLYSVITISLGAMIGSGIFVLPGLGFKIAGPSIILAYTLAGLIVLPSALSKAEMATAMPESGGTYLYIDRSMGPLYGTIAGIGAWFSLVFKSAFALVGLGAYLLLFVNIPSSSLIYVAMGLATLLLIVNMLGVKQTGQLQAVIVTLVMFALTIFILDGATFVNQENFHPFFEHGIGGILGATGFVFVSYAGVTKIASIAEEVENPGRNIPIAIILSVILMIFVYSMVVFVIVGLAPAKELTTSLTPMALAGRQFLGRFGEIAIGIVAVFALLSMANAGILSSTRFPLAMSRDKLAPKKLSEINDRFTTPIYSILFTGVILLVLIRFVPVFELAKLASAFKILVFTFINVALIAFRESGLESYEPEFISPFYPWIQIFGILGGILLLTQMGPLSLLGALGLIILGLVWYAIFGRERTDREGAALNAIRRARKDYYYKQTESLFQTGGAGGILIATDNRTNSALRKSLCSVAEPMMTRRGGQLNVVKFVEVPDQVPLSSAVEKRTIDDDSFNADVKGLLEGAKFNVKINNIVSHNLKKSVVNYASEKNLNLVIAPYETKRFHGALFGHDVDYYINKINSDLIFVRPGTSPGEVKKITIIGNKGPYSPLEVSIADAVAQYHDASIRLLHIVEDDIKDEHLTTINQYHEEIADLNTVPTDHEIMKSNDWESVSQGISEDTDMVIISTSAHHILFDVLVETLPEKLLKSLDCTVLLVHQHEPRRHTFLRYIIEKITH